MTYLPAIIILGTLLAYIAIGLWAARRVKSANGFLIASGKLGILPITGTYVATFTSAVTVLGGPAGIFNAGISYIWLYITFAVGACFTAIVAARYRRAELTTPADFFKVRYGSPLMEKLNAAGTIIALVFSLIAQFTAMGIVWSLALGRSFQEGILLAAVAMVIIIVAGGLESVAWSDVFKAGIFFIAVTLAGIWTLVKFGGFRVMVTQALAVNPDFADLSTGMGGAVGIFFLFLTWSCGIGTHPQYLQRISASFDRRTGILQYVIGWPFIALIFVFLTIIGIGTIINVTELPAGFTRDYLGPLFIQQNAPVAIYGLYLAGLTAAALSTADSVIQLTVTYISHNLVRGALRPDISDRSLLLLSRVASLVLVIFIALLTLFQWKWIVYIAAYCWGILAILYFAPTVLGLYWRRANAQGALSSVIGGLIAFVIAQSLALFGKWPFAEVPPTGVGVIAGMLLMIVVSISTPPSNKEQLSVFFEK